MLLLTGNKKGEITQEVKQEPTQVAVQYKTQENSEGLATIEVTPIRLSTTENNSFSVSLSTHSVVLDKDLKDISIIVDDKGNEYKPVSWDGGAGGHHISGTLVFPNLSKDASKITLTIKGIANIDRVFSWNL